MRAIVRASRVSGDYRRITGGVECGATGCLKGWFVAIYEAPGPIIIGPISPGTSEPTGVVLVN